MVQRIGPTNCLFRQLTQREAIFPKGSWHSVRDEFASLGATVIDADESQVEYTPSISN